MENVIEVKGLAKLFGNKAALKNVNFVVKKGETIGFLGPNGSGKTTTIKILTAQLQATAGEVKIFDQPVKKLKDPSYMKRIGILTDNSSLYERLTIHDNLALYCDLYGVEKGRIHEVLDSVNLLQDRKKRVQKLSRGMKQRVVLARAILHKPDLLFLDEPTSALDPVNMKHIHAGLKQLNAEGATIFLTTHDMQEAEDICDQVAFLNNGEIVMYDTPQNVRTQQKNTTVSLLLKGNRTVTVENNAQGAEEIYEYMKAGQILTIHSNEPTLGDVFEELTGRNLSCNFHSNE